MSETRRKLTPEQEAKKKERRERFGALWKQVAAMSELERVQLANKLGIVTCEGHELSLCNTMLVALQNPTASIVGGFRQWLKQGRCVRKGEHGLMIWVPTGGKESEPGPMAMIVYGSAPSQVANGHRFIIGTVFDISQTAELEPQAQPQTEPVREIVADLVPA